jgi:phosphohistidine phosphatase
MVRTVTLLRHAKSSREDLRLADIDRPLAERGRADAPRMGQWMARQYTSKGHGITPDLVLCSPSVRTRETHALIASALPAKIETRFDAKLYHAEAARLLRTIQDLPGRVHHVLLIGHNPGFHDLALRLTGAGDRGLRRALAEKFSTCGCAVLSFDVTTWAEVAPKTGTLLHWMSPKRLA